MRRSIVLFILSFLVSVCLSVVRLMFLFLFFLPSFLPYVFILPFFIHSFILSSFIHSFFPSFSFLLPSFLMLNLKTTGHIQIFYIANNCNTIRLVPFWVRAACDLQLASYSSKQALCSLSHTLFCVCFYA